MKKLFTISMTGILFLFVHVTAFAQDSTSGAVKHINETSEQADKLHGKKIQQESLSIKKYEKIDKGKATGTKKKTCTKCRRRHHASSAK